jgi:protein disulfide-isomerase A1
MKIAVVGYFDSDDEESRKTFENVAAAHHRDFVFGICAEQSLSDTEEIQRPGIVLYKDFDNEKEIFQNDRLDDEEAIWHFVKSVSTPLIVDFRPELHNDFVKVYFP